LKKYSYNINDILISFKVEDGLLVFGEKFYISKYEKKYDYFSLNYINGKFFMDISDHFIWKSFMKIEEYRIIRLNKILK